MTITKPVCALIMVYGLAACGPESPQQPAPDLDTAAKQPAFSAESHVKTLADSISSGISVDPHTFARPQEAWVKSMHLDLTADFTRQILHGTASLNIERASGVTKIVLDTRKLLIEKVELLHAGSQSPLQFSLGTQDPNLGRPLLIQLPENNQSELQILLHYATSPQASGLQWLTPEQTAGKQHPFLFTQSQAIHARSWIPLQDTPAVRMTYRATIRTPVNLRAVMSAANDTSNEMNADGVYHFDMPQAIPAYLIALGVGNLVFVPMSERTGVFAEPSLAQAAAAEFADTEKMLQISEQLYGPYRWGRYDLLILPPSFPFGGMENPRLSFITPTIIAGDKSLVSLIAHELAHSWAGNLVSNATWRDLWLNEGFTSFLTTRIMEAVYGKRRADMEYYLDYQDLKKELAELPEGDQILAIDLQGRDPDDVFSGVPYTKGQMFLGWLESEFGREKLDVFLRNYFDQFSFQSITTDQFLVYLNKHLVEKYPGIVNQEAIKQWVFSPGLPSSSMVPQSNAFAQIKRNSDDWLDGRNKLANLQSAQWSVHEWLYFLNNLPDDLSSEQLRNLDNTFDLTNSRNNEIAHSWLIHVIRHDYQPGFARLEEYLVGIGRRKLITPLYEELVKIDAHRGFAERVYQRARPGYHPLAQVTVDAILAGDS